MTLPLSSQVTRFVFPPNSLHIRLTFNLKVLHSMHGSEWETSKEVGQVVFALKHFFIALKQAVIIRSHSNELDQRPTPIATSNFG